MSKKTSAEILKEDAAEMEAEEKALLEGAVPEKPDSETEKPETGAEKRDWVDEAYKCFIKDAADIDPTDPVKAVGAYFEKNATDELKARCKAEGKDAALCWKFIEAVARKALGGRNGHIDPAVVYAIAMHWFEDVPKDWDAAPAKATARKAKPTAEKKAKPKKPAEKKAKPKKPAETPAEIRKEKAKAKKAAQKAKAAAKKPKRPKNVQGFFFDMMLLDTPNEDDVSSPQGAPVRPAEENAVAPSAQAGTSSESEVRK